MDEVMKSLNVKELVIGVTDGMPANAKVGTLIISGAKLWVKVDSGAPEVVTSA